MSQAERKRLPVRMPPTYKGISKSGHKKISLKKLLSKNYPKENIRVLCRASRRILLKIINWKFLLNFAKIDTQLSFLREKVQNSWTKQLFSGKIMSRAKSCLWAKFYNKLTTGFHDIFVSWKIDITRQSLTSSNLSQIRSNCTCLTTHTMTTVSPWIRLKTNL